MEYPFEVDERMKKIFQEQFCGEESIRGILITLKKLGYSQMQCVFLLIDQLKLSLSEANKMFQEARVW